MMKLPASLVRVIEHFERLPGIGHRSAERLTFSLLRGKVDVARGFAEALSRLHAETLFCSTCGNISEHDMCSVCRDDSRDAGQICVVAEPLDLVALESAGIYRGRYAVLGGLISPLDRIGPEDLHLNTIFTQIEANPGAEVIWALDPSPEGEATVAYLEDALSSRFPGVRMTRLARGLASSTHIEFADPLTLARALEGRH